MLARYRTVYRAVATDRRRRFAQPTGCFLRRPALQCRHTTIWLPKGAASHELAAAVAKRTDKERTGYEHRPDHRLGHRPHRTQHRHQGRARARMARAFERRGIRHLVRREPEEPDLRVWAARARADHHSRLRAHFL